MNCPALPIAEDECFAWPGIDGVLAIVAARRSPNPAAAESRSTWGRLPGAVASMVRFISFTVGIKRSRVRLPPGSPEALRRRRDPPSTRLRHADADRPIAERVDMAAVAQIGVGARAPIPHLEIVPPHGARLVGRGDRIEVHDVIAVADVDELA